MLTSQFLLTCTRVNLKRFPNGFFQLGIFIWYHFGYGPVPPSGLLQFKKYPLTFIGLLSNGLKLS